MMNIKAYIYGSRGNDRDNVNYEVALVRDRDDVTGSTYVDHWARGRTYYVGQNEVRRFDFDKLEENFLTRSSLLAVQRTTRQLYASATRMIN
jgi:hypothetical protein